jgi:hypothetical protein
VLHGFFNTLNPFVHLKMQFKKQKIVISFKFISPIFSTKKTKTLNNKTTPSQQEDNTESLHIWLHFLLQMEILISLFLIHPLSVHISQSHIEEREGRRWKFRLQYASGSNSTFILVNPTRF